MGAAVGGHRGIVGVAAGQASVEEVLPPVAAAEAVHQHALRIVDVDPHPLGSRHLDGVAPGGGVGVDGVFHGAGTVADTRLPAAATHRRVPEGAALGEGEGAGVGGEHDEAVGDGLGGDGVGEHREAVDEEHQAVAEAGEGAGVEGQMGIGVAIGAADPPAAGQDLDVAVGFKGQRGVVVAADEELALGEAVGAEGQHRALHLRAAPQLADTVGAVHADTRHAVVVEAAVGITPYLAPPAVDIVHGAEGDAVAHGQGALHTAQHRVAETLGEIEHLGDLDRAREAVASQGQPDIRRHAVGGRLAEGVDDGDVRRGVGVADGDVVGEDVLRREAPQRRRIIVQPPYRCLGGDNGFVNDNHCVVGSVGDAVEDEGVAAVDEGRRVEVQLGVPLAAAPLPGGCDGRDCCVGRYVFLAGGSVGQRQEQQEC